MLEITIELSPDRIPRPDVVTRESTNELSDLAGEALAETNLWPVLTGDSLRGLGAEARGDEVAITNMEPYGPYVEARTGAARRTLDQAIDGKIVPQLGRSLVRDWRRKIRRRRGRS